MKLYRPKELHRVAGLSRRQVRDWDRKGVLSCQKREKSNGWRKFSEEDIEQNLAKMKLRKLGFSLEVIRKLDYSKVIKLIKFYEKEI